MTYFKLNFNYYTEHFKITNYQNKFYFFLNIHKFGLTIKLNKMSYSISN